MAEAATVSRGERSRRELADIAIRQFEKKGFDATTVEEIAAAADYTPRTFFRQFPSKEDVVFFDLPDILMPIEAQLEDPDPPPAWPAVCAVLTANATAWGKAGPKLAESRTRLIHEEPALYRRFLEIAWEWEQVIAKVFASERKVDPKKDIRSQLLAAVVVGACLTSLRVWLERGGTLIEHFEEALDLIEQGFDVPSRR